jgi:hypothetical protein
LSERSERKGHRPPETGLGLESRNSSESTSEIGIYHNFSKFSIFCTH